MYISAIMNNSSTPQNKQQHFKAIQMSSSAHNWVFSQVTNLNSLKTIAIICETQRKNPANIFVHTIKTEKGPKLLAFYKGKFVKQGVNETVTSFFRALARNNMFGGFDDTYIKVSKTQGNTARKFLETSIKENTQTLPAEELIKVFSGGF